MGSFKTVLTENQRNILKKIISNGTCYRIDCNECPLQCLEYPCVDIYNTEKIAQTILRLSE